MLLLSLTTSAIDFEFAYQDKWKQPLEMNQGFHETKKGVLYAVYLIHFMIHICNWNKRQRDWTKIRARVTWNHNVHVFNKKIV